MAVWLAKGCWKVGHNNVSSALTEPTAGAEIGELPHQQRQLGCPHPLQGCPPEERPDTVNIDLLQVLCRILRTIIEKSTLGRMMQANHLYRNILILLKEDERGDAAGSPAMFSWLSRSTYIGHCGAALNTYLRSSRG